MQIKTYVWVGMLSVALGTSAAVPTGTGVSTDLQNSPKVVDFANRSGLGTVEPTALPSVQGAYIDEPRDLEITKPTLPSEQLIGRISPEVFRDLADIERANIFLKLQIQREQLKSDLEKVQAEYRQTRLDEIGKREEIIRDRIAWWQEQEELRAEVEAKKSKAAMLDQQILEAEAMRKQMRQKAIAASEGQGNFPLAELYSVVDIKGVNGRLTARLKPTSADNFVTVKVGDKLTSGHVIKEITPTTVVADFNGTISEATIVFVYPEKEK